MKDIEKMLSEKRSEIDELQVPGELEARLQGALDRRIDNQKKRKGNYRLKIAAVLIAVMLVGYQFDALTYYGKKLIGYDQVLEGSLKQLNELGKGQTVGKGHTFSNGISIMIDGMMLDDNQLIIFYTVKDPGGHVDQAEVPRIWNIKGFLKRYFQNGGYGMMNDEKTEIKNIDSFDPPMFWEKGLTVEVGVSTNGRVEMGEINIVINRNEAMGHTLKEKINKSIKVDDNTITFESISASPTTTVVKGSIQNLLQLAIDELKEERLRPTDIDLRLIANGKELKAQGGGAGTDMKGITFHHAYEPLPKDLKQLQLKLVSFGADHDVKMNVSLDKTGKPQKIKIMSQEISIEKVEERSGETYITITSEDSVLLTRVHLLADGNVIKLKETISNTYDKTRDGKILHTRTLHYPGRGEKLQLDVQRMTYEKVYNKVIDIPIE